MTSPSGKAEGRRQKEVRKKRNKEEGKNISALCPVFPI
jgi:hypothetical protein